MESTTILVEAERKFMIKLCNAMTPVMVESFHELFKKSVEESKGRQTLIRFQVLLQEIQHWNNTMVKQHTDTIIRSCAMFPNLLAAVFVISVKIMSAVRISSESKKINIKLPSNDVFVHSCYIAAAADLYESPFIFTEKMSETERRMKLAARIEPLIKRVVDDFIPVQQILETYIPNFTGELDMTSGEDPADPDTAEEQLLPVPETPVPAAAPETTESPLPQTEAVSPLPQPLGEEEEDSVKNVQVAKPPSPQAVHHETLFDDAPEK